MTPEAHVTPVDSRSLRSLSLYALLALSILLILARLLSYDEPLEWDIGTYAVVAREMLHGERLYADVWDMKPPAIFATFAAAQLLAGDGFLSVYLLSVTAAVVTMLGVYRAASVAGRAAGLWAATFWAAMCFEPWIDGNLPNTEVFINAAVAWAFALWLRADAGDGRGWWRWLSIGLLFALASLYKHVAVAPAICLAVAEIAFPSNADKGRRGALDRVTVVATVGFHVWLAVFLYFIATDRGWLLWQTLVVSPRAYAGGMIANLLGSFAIGKGISGYLAFALPAVVLTLIAMAMGTRAAPRRAWVLFASLAAGTHLAVALPGTFLSHYHQLWFVPLAIGAGWGAAALPKAPGLHSRRLAAAAAALALITVIYPQAHWSTLSGPERGRRKHRDFFMWANEAARDADRMLLPGETFYTWSDEAYAYFVARRHPPAVALWKSHTTSGPMADWLTRRTLEDLRRNPPELFLHWGTPLGPAGHPILEWSREYYDPLPGAGQRYFPMFFFVRKGGALQQRLTAPSTQPSLSSSSKDV